MQAGYRPDIDGLRAVAVLGVVFYHARVPGFGGGYVGVDVFFVISGYLITLLLADAGHEPLPATLSRFYLRRARRIIPALLLVCSVTTIAAAILLMPWDLERFGRYLAFSMGMLSNVPAWFEQADYFDSRIAYAPLTHLWSIAVEEQFYLVYPLLLYAIGKLLPRRRAAILIAMMATSFGLCVLASRYRPVMNFFLAPTRAWELLLGAVLASNPHLPVRRRWLGELCGTAGAVALLASIGWYSARMVYPGVATLVPCLAAALLIAAGRGTVSSRCLSLAPLTLTGRLSYSLYLWHLPILLLFAYFEIRQVDAARTAVLLGITYLVAWLSWTFVETPMRGGFVVRSDRRFAGCALAASGVLALVGMGLWKSDGLPRRFPDELAALDQNWMASSGRILKCVNLPLERIANGDLCSFGPAGPDIPRIVVWGDSHAMALLTGWEALANRSGQRIFFAVKPACRPLLGISNATDSAARQLACARFNLAVIEALKKIRPQRVILNAHWIDPDVDLERSDGHAAVPGKSQFRYGLERTLNEIDSTGSSTCAVLDVPVLQYQLPYAVGMANRRGIPEDFLSFSRTAALAQFTGPERDFADLRRDGRLRTVDLKDSICPKDGCIYRAQGGLLYADRDHLSVHGAKFVSSTLDACLHDDVATQRHPDAKIAARASH